MKKRGRHHFIISSMGLEKAYVAACLNDMLTEENDNFFEGWKKVIGREALDEISAISWGSYYLSLTGIPKKVHRHVYNVDYAQYIRLCYEHIGPIYDSVFSEYGFSGVTFFLKHNDLKQMMTIFSDNGGRKNAPCEAFGEITERMQTIYEEHIFKGDKRYANVTALSRRLSGYGDLRRGYDDVTGISGHAFFYMEPGVITPETLRGRMEHTKYRELHIECVELEKSIREGLADEACQRIDSLFLRTLKKSVSYRQCRIVLEHVRRAFFEAGVMYGGHCVTDRKFFDLRNYASLEECHSVVSEAVVELCRYISGSGKALSFISREAVYFIKTRYREELSLSRVARYVNVTPSYLSHVFNREVGSGINEYITGVRVERAKRLLLGTNDKISKIAGDVGYVNTRHFSAVFKKWTGMTARQYRSGKMNGVEEV